MIQLFQAATAPVISPPETAVLEIATQLTSKGSMPIDVFPAQV